MALTNAEKQRAYRERQKAKETADVLFGGQMWVTVNDFLEGVKFDLQDFWAQLQYAEKVETEEFTEERDTVWQKAYKEARAAAVEAGEYDPDEDEDDEFWQAADDAVKDWMEDVDDYNGNFVRYELTDLLEAHREAHGSL
jgi:hypothetical protein